MYIKNVISFITTYLIKATFAGKLLHQPVDITMDCHHIMIYHGALRKSPKNRYLQNRK